MTANKLEGKAPMNTDKLWELERKWRAEANSLRDQCLQLSDPSYLHREAAKIDERADELAAALRAEQAVGEEQRARELFADELEKAGMAKTAKHCRAGKLIAGHQPALRAIRRALGTAHQPENLGEFVISLLIAGGYVTQEKVDEARKIALSHGPYEMPAREIKKVNDYIKDYPECSGNPSSCPENEGYGCCKSAQWRVIQFGGSFKRGTERWEVYEPNGSGGVVEESDIKDETVRRLLDYLAAAPGGEGEVGRG